MATDLEAARLLCTYELIKFTSERHVNNLIFCYNSIVHKAAALRDNNEDFRKLSM